MVARKKQKNKQIYNKRLTRRMAIANKTCVSGKN